MDQIEALISVSEFCEQKVENNCTSNQLTGYAWWLDINGNQRQYWHGDGDKNTTGCQCSFDNTCDSRFNDNNLCNCDDREVNRDVGFLSSRDQLPVTQLAYGASDHRYSFIHYALGDLVCYGKRGLYPSEAGDTDFLFKASYTGSNEYMLTGSQLPIEFGNIIFGNELNAWNGITFTAPVHGIYSFKLQISLEYGGRGYRVRAVINDETSGLEQLLENSSYYQYYFGNTFTFEIDRELHLGDVLKFTDHQIYDNSYQDYNEYKCRTNNVEHSCSYVTGRLLKKL